MKKIIQSKEMEISNQKIKEKENDREFFCDIVCIAVMEYRQFLRKKMLKEGIEKDKIRKVLEI